MQPYLIGVIPARWASSRFPGKPLHHIAGKALIQRVWEQVRQCNHLQRIIIATDDERIQKACQHFGAEVMMTATTHETGTDRIAEVASHFPEATHWINIQGDEPEIAPHLIDELAQCLCEHPELEMVTAANPMEAEEPIARDPNVVKVVLGLNHQALYFSRSPIPFYRNAVEGLPMYRHHGIYGYRHDFLNQFVAMPPTPLERAESLEQLRALEMGARIHVIITPETSMGIDTPEQAAALEQKLMRG